MATGSKYTRKTGTGATSVGSTSNKASSSGSSGSSTAAKNITSSSASIIPSAMKTGANQTGVPGTLTPASQSPTSTSTGIPTVKSGTVSGNYVTASNPQGIVKTNDGSITTQRGRDIRAAQVAAGRGDTRENMDIRKAYIEHPTTTQAEIENMRNLTEDQQVAAIKRQEGIANVTATGTLDVTEQNTTANKVKSLQDQIANLTAQDPTNPRIAQLQSQISVVTQQTGVDAKTQRQIDKVKAAIESISKQPRTPANIGRLDRLNKALQTLSGEANVQGSDINKIADTPTDVENQQPVAEDISTFEEELGIKSEEELEEEFFNTAMGEIFDRQESMLSQEMNQQRQELELAQQGRAEQRENEIKRNEALLLAQSSGKQGIAITNPQIAAGLVLEGIKFLDDMDRQDALDMQRLVLDQDKIKLQLDANKASQLDQFIQRKRQEAIQMTQLKWGREQQLYQRQQQEMMNNIALAQAMPGKFTVDMVDGQIQLAKRDMAADMNAAMAEAGILQSQLMDFAAKNNIDVNEMGTWETAATMIGSKYMIPGFENLLKPSNSMEDISNMLNVMGSMKGMPQEFISEMLKTMPMKAAQLTAEDQGMLNAISQGFGTQAPDIAGGWSIIQTGTNDYGDPIYSRYNKNTNELQSLNGSSLSGGYSGSNGYSPGGIDSSNFKTVDPAASKTGYVYDQQTDSYDFGSYIPGRDECGEYVNDAIGRPNEYGNMLADKTRNIVSQDPFAGATFIQDTLQPYGHVGLVNKVTDEGIYISDANHRGSAEKGESRSWQFIPYGDSFFDKVVGYGQGVAQAPTGQAGQKPSVNEYRDSTLAQIRNNKITNTDLSKAKVIAEKQGWSKEYQEALDYGTPISDTVALKYNIDLNTPQGKFNDLMRMRQQAGFGNESYQEIDEDQMLKLTTKQELGRDLKRAKEIFNDFKNKGLSLQDLSDKSSREMQRQFEKIGIDPTESLEMWRELERLTGTALANKIKELSGVAVAEQEYKRLEKYNPNVSMTDQKFGASLDDALIDYNIAQDRLASHWGFESPEQMDEAFKTGKSGIRNADDGYSKEVEILRLANEKGFAEDDMNALFNEALKTNSYPVALNKILEYLQK